MLNTFEADLVLKLQGVTRQPWLDNVMTAFTGLGDAGTIAVLSCAALLIPPKLRKTGLMASVALAVETLIVNVMLKPLVGRIRPYFINEAIEVLTRRPGDFSFPSGHTGSCFAVAGVFLFCLPKRYGIPAMVFAVLMGISRMYVGVHYPTDVLAGAFIGMAVAFAAVKTMKSLECRQSLPEFGSGRKTK